MNAGSNLTESNQTGLADPARRSPRRPYRHKIRTLSRINLDESQGAVLRDLNEFGITMQTMTSLALDQQVRLRFELPAPRVRVEAAGRVVWTDAWGQVGIQFLDLPAGSRLLLKEWIFTQILSAAYLFAPVASVAVASQQADGVNELLFSASPRPVIPIEPQEIPVAAVEPRPQRVRLLWCPVPISLSALAKLVDGLVVVCSVLLFGVIAMVVTSVLPTWLLTLALATAVTVVFGALYWLLFAVCFHSTPGEHLARMACSEQRAGTIREEEARFR